MRRRRLQERLTPAQLVKRRQRRTRRAVAQVREALTFTPCCNVRLIPPRFEGDEWNCPECRRRFTILDLEEAHRLRFPERVRETRLVLGLDDPPGYKPLAERVGAFIGRMVRTR